MTPLGLSWAQPHILYLLPLTLIALLPLLDRRHVGGIASRHPHLHRLWANRNGLHPTPPVTRRRTPHGLLLCLGLSLTLIALARPQWGEIEELRFDQQREILIGLDLSRSMLTRDIPPDRLSRSKLLVRALLDELEGERVGLALFAGTAFLQSPLSADHEILRDLLSDLDPSFLPQGGTNFERLLETSLEAFSEGGEADRFLIILSDGEDQASPWREFLPRVQARGIRIISLGVGTSEGGLIPDGTDGFVKDARGAVILSRLQTSTLEELAQATQGRFAEASSWIDLAALIDQTVAQGRMGSFLEEKDLRRQERFQFFLVPALLFLFSSALWDIPATPSGRRAGGPWGKISPPAPTFDEAAPRVLSVLAALLLSLLLASAPTRACAATGEPEPAPSALENLVASLAAKARRSADDYAALAQTTIDFAQHPPPTQRATLPGILQDGLQAVDRGEREDPEAADWPALRTRLEALEQQQQEEEQRQEQQEQQDQGEEQGDPGEGETSSEGSQGSSSEGEQPPSESGSGGNQGDSAPDKAPSTESESASDSSAADEEKSRAEEPRPITAPEAGLSDSESDSDPETSPPSSPTEETRVVGGGTGRDEDLLRENPELAEAIARMERVSEGDSPATLFQRMRGEDAQTREQDGEKNW